LSHDGHEFGEKAVHPILGRCLPADPSLPAVPRLRSRRFDKRSVSATRNEECDRPAVTAFFASSAFVVPADPEDRPVSRKLDLRAAAGQDVEHEQHERDNQD
jgi:hypothetical protein